MSVILFRQTFLWPKERLPLSKVRPLNLLPFEIARKKSAQSSRNYQKPDVLHEYSIMPNNYT